jgi:carotenoid cleavage dioxygenase-like enzyme
LLTTVVSPYLCGNFAPVQREVTSDDLYVEGQIPHELSGMLVRNGPNPRFSPQGKYHWVDGDGMLHGIELLLGKANYRNRFVQTRAFQSEQKAGQSIWKTGLLEPPQLDLAPNNAFSPFKNTANTSLVWHAGKLLALWEGAEPYEIQLPSLETIGPYYYQGQLTSRVTAHPKVDFNTGEMIFFGYYPTGSSHLLYGVVSATGQIIRTVPIDLPAGVMMHDCAVTPNYTIILDLPLRFSLDRWRQGDTAYFFRKDIASRFGILPRHGDNNSIRWFESSPCYIFHTVNAYEEGEEVVLYACRLDSTNCFDIPTEPNHQLDDRPRLHRWRFNLRTGDTH